MNFTDQTPEDILQHPFAAKFLKVLDGVLEFKDITVHLGTQKSFIPVLCYDRNFLRNYLYDLGNFPDSIYFTRKNYEKLIFNAYDIYRYKGTRKGFEILVDVLCEGTIVSLEARYIPAKKLEPSTILYENDIVNPDSPCFLPDEVMLTESISDPLDYPFLFGADDFDYYEPFAGIVIKTSLAGNTTFENYMRSLLPLFLPVTQADQFNVQFIN